MTMRLNMAAFADCIGKIAEQGNISRPEAEAVLQDVANRVDVLRRKGAADPITQAAAEKAQQALTKAKQVKIDAIRNATKRDTWLAPILSGKVDDAIHKIRAKLYWAPGTDPKDNIQTFWRGLQSQLSSKLYANLRKEGLLEAARNPDFMRNIAREMWKINAGVASEAASKDPARRIAEITAPIAEYIKKRQNAEGALIADAKDFVAHTSHDPYLMRRGGRAGDKPPTADQAYQVWRNFIMPRLSDKTFEDVEVRPGETDAQAKDRFLRGAFEALVTGVRKTQSGDGSGYVKPQFEGSYNIARKLSEGRVLFFRDADGWSDYMSQYGKQRNFYSLMNDTVASGTRRIALMKFLGTNPENNFSQIIDRIGEHFRSQDMDGTVKFNNDLKGNLIQPSVYEVMGRLDGSANIPVNNLAATIGRTIRAFYRMVYLGGVSLTHAASLISTFPTEAAHHGIGVFERFNALGKALVPDWMKAEDRAGVLADLGAYGDGASRAAFDGFDHGMNLPGVMAQAEHYFHTAVGIDYLFGHSRAGFREMLAHNLGRQMEKPLEALEPHLRNLLGSYGIRQSEWDLLRAGDPLRTEDGKSYLTPSTALQLDGDKVAAHLQGAGALLADAKPEDALRAVEDYRQDLADRLMMYFEDGADHAVIKQGVRESALLKGSVRPGTWQDEVLSSFMMFKSWPLAMMHQAIGREFYQGLSTRDTALGIGAIVGLSTIAGYIRMSARDAFYGDQQRLPKSPGDAAKIALAALAQGGGLGILGDMLFGEMNRFGVSNASSIGGPVATDVAQLAKIFYEWEGSIGSDKAKDVWPELVRFGINHVPYGNLFYLKGSLDYMAWFHIYEAMHPGWWTRTNRQMQKEQGRSMLGYSPGAPVPYGVPPLYVSSGNRSAGLFGAH